MRAMTLSDCGPERIQEQQLAIFLKASSMFEEVGGRIRLGA